MAKIAYRIVCPDCGKTVGVSVLGNIFSHMTDERTWWPITCPRSLTPAEGIKAIYSEKRRPENIQAEKRQKHAVGRTAMNNRCNARTAANKPCRRPAAYKRGSVWYCPSHKNG